MPGTLWIWQQEMVTTRLLGRRGVWCAWIDICYLHSFSSYSCVQGGALSVWSVLGKFLVQSYIYLDQLYFLAKRLVWHGVLFFPHLYLANVGCRPKYSDNTKSGRPGGNECSECIPVQHFSALCISNMWPRLCRKRKTKVYLVLEKSVSCKPMFKGCSHQACFHPWTVVTAVMLILQPKIGFRS